MISMTDGLKGIKGFIKSIMGKKKGDDIHTGDITHHVQEIPLLEMHFSKSNAGFITEDISFTSRGYSMDEAFEGLKKMVKEFKESIIVNK